LILSLSPEKSNLSCIIHLKINVAKNKNKGQNQSGYGKEALRVAFWFCPLFFGNKSSKTVTSPPVIAEIFCAVSGLSAFPLAARHTVALEQQCFFENELGFCLVFSKYFLNCMKGLFHKRSKNASKKFQKFSLDFMFHL